jgi:hypothetical protein
LIYSSDFLILLLKDVKLIIGGRDNFGVIFHPLFLMKNEDYLNEGFEPSKLSIPHLSLILSKHGIDVPMQKQTKSFYVQLFKEKLTPKVSDIKKEMLKVKASDEGIVKINLKENEPVFNSNLNLILVQKQSQSSRSHAHPCKLV